MAFTKKRIEFTFQLGTGAFGEDGFNTVTVAGLRSQVQIASAGGPSMGMANFRIYGMTPSMMNSLSYIVRASDGQVQIRLNRVQINAGDADPLPIIYVGQVNNAIIDPNGVPSVSMMFSAVAGGFEAIKSAPPVSYPGTASVVTILSSLASANNYGFENNGVSASLATPYFSGSPREQMLKCVQAADIEWNALDNGVLAIWPKGGYRGASTAIPLFSPETGMVGYPMNRGLGAAVRSVFNPALRLGQLCQVKSSLPFANGKFVMFEIAHDISCELPGGPWFSAFTGVPING